MEIRGCTQTQILLEDLKNQLQASKQACPLAGSSLTNGVETRKASNLMHKIIGGEENEDVLEAKWLHSVWTKSKA